MLEQPTKVTSDALRHMTTRTNREDNIWLAGGKVSAEGVDRRVKSHKSQLSAPFVREILLADWEKGCKCFEQKENQAKGPRRPRRRKQVENPI